MIDPARTAPARGGPDQPPAPATDGEEHVAVVFVHGMGSQRRYEELSGLVQELESYDRELGPGNGAGRLKHAGVRFELQHGDPSETISYIELDFHRPDGRGGDVRETYRFYEVYWAPVTAVGVPWWRVLLWLIGQARNPWRVLGSDWRSRARYRVSNLYKVYERVKRRLAGSPVEQAEAEQVLAQVVSAYDAFHDSMARTLYQRGTFADFMAFLDSDRWPMPAPELAAGPRPRERDAEARRRLAVAWRRTYLLAECRNAAVLLSILVALLLFFAILAAAVAGIISPMPLPAPLANGTFSPPTIIFSSITLILSFLGIKRFLEHFLGDVAFWTSYEETAARHRLRKEIEQIAFTTLQHVFHPPACKGVVLVAHSLGSSIAYEALLDLAKVNRTAGAEPVALDKLRYFVTYGSPIDKIHYFFQNQRADSLRYQRVVESARGDVRAFLARADERVARWINFWDPADVISGSLQSPLPLSWEDPSSGEPIGPGRRRQLQIANIEVAGGSPRPDTSHTGYLRSPAIHATVVPTIYNCIFNDRFQDPLPARAPWSIQLALAIPILLTWLATPVLWLFGQVYSLLALLLRVLPSRLELGPPLWKHRLLVLQRAGLTWAARIVQGLALLLVWVGSFAFGLIAPWAIDWTYRAINAGLGAAQFLRAFGLPIPARVVQPEPTELFRLILAVPPAVAALSVVALVLYVILLLISLLLNNLRSRVRLGPTAPGPARPPAYPPAAARAAPRGSASPRPPRRQRPPRRR